MMNIWVREEATRQMARWNISDYPSGNPTWYRPMFESCLRAGLLEAARRMPEIIEVLFVNGQDARADRLVLTVDGADPFDLGGWCREAAAEMLAAELRALAGEEPSYD